MSTNKTALSEAMLKGASESAITAALQDANNYVIKNEKKNK